METEESKVNDKEEVAYTLVLFYSSEMQATLSKKETVNAS